MSLYSSKSVVSQTLFAFLSIRTEIIFVTEIVKIINLKKKLKVTKTVDFLGQNEISF
jgi:hypothetical protein